MRALVLAALAVAALAPAAAAYPQFQLSRDQTCTACHFVPSGGGGLLNENGIATAESISQFGTNGEFMYGKVPTPDWLQLGGEFRASAGYLRTPQQYLTGFPMQADLYARAVWKGFSVLGELGYRPAPYGPVAQPVPVWSREHYIMWQSNAGGNDGLYIRAGRFMPVFGLRFAEHPDYTRRFGGTPLWSETYGAAVAYVVPQWEVHVTGFAKDPIMDRVRQNSGGAAYGEVRMTEQAQVGAGAMVEVSDVDKKYRADLTAKYYFKGPDLLLEGEAQYVRQTVDGGGSANQLVSYVMASWFLPHGMLMDVGYGHYDSDLAVKNLDRDAFDLNYHWFVSSHFEAVLNARLELIGQTAGGPTGSYVLIQGHYRL